MPSVARDCPQCQKYSQVPFASQTELRCPVCSQKWSTAEDVSRIFESCLFCQCRQFYLQKDFNQALGCLVMLTGIILVPWTYGLSLPFVAFVDWLFYKRVPTLVVCYRCGAEFRGFVTLKHFKPFLHHIGLKYDKYRDGS